jgi:hypothetical protein
MAIARLVEVLVVVMVEYHCGMEIRFRELEKHDLNTRLKISCQKCIRQKPRKPPIAYLCVLKASSADWHKPSRTRFRLIFVLKIRPLTNLNGHMFMYLEP